MFDNSKSIWLALPLVATLGLAGCGGGSDSDSSNNSGGGTTPTTTAINGVAMAGAVSGQVCAYPVGSNGGIGATALACVNTTPGTGAYAMSIADYIGNVILAATGTYIDEATGQTITLTAQNALRSATGWDVGGETMNVAITPLTEAAVRAALAAGGVTQANFLNAMLQLANALQIQVANGDEAYDAIVGTLPALSGGSNNQLAYAAFLDLFSTAQGQYCGNNGGCNMFSYLDNVLSLIGSQGGTDQFRQSLQTAYAAWQSAQANAPYVCSYSGGAFTCVPNNGGNNSGNNGGNSGGTTGSYNLNLIVTAMGTTTPLTITEVPKPDNQSQFCTSALELAQGQANVPGATWTMNSCSFDGMHGVITATVNITSPITMSIPYTVDYTYVAR